MKFVVRTAPVAVVALLAASPAFADSPVAEKLFRDAQEAMKAEHYADACPKFAESNRLDPQLGTLLNLAACHEKEGKVASAWSDYMTLAELAGRAGDKGRADYAKKRIAAIEPTMPQLELKVPAGTTFTEVKLDQQSLGAAATMTTIPIDPGVHTLAFQTATQSWTQSVTIGATGKVVVEVKIPTATTTTTTTTKSPSLAAPQNGAELGASPSTPTPTPSGSGGGLRVTGLVLGGLGIVGLGVGGVFGGFALGNKSDVDAHCQGNLCDATGFAAQQDAHTNATISTVGLIAGGVLVATGLTLFILGNAKGSRSALVVPASRGVAFAW